MGSGDTIRAGAVAAGGFRPGGRFVACAAMEFWERFAMSGWESLLVLILIDHVLAGGSAPVLGATAFERFTQAVFGPLSRTGLASQIYGYAKALIYLAIPLGGLLGDMIGSRRPMVAAGGAGMLVGLLCMLNMHSFLIGLVPFAIGTGMLKGNLSAEIGFLFKDHARRRQSYATYLGFLNAGVICGPLVCGALAVTAGWPAAMGAAAIAVAIGLAGYGMSGLLRATGAVERAPIAMAERPDRRSRDQQGAAALLVIALTAIYCCYSAYAQLTNIFLVWARDRIDLHVGGWAMPVAWFQSLDGLFTLALIAGSGIGFRALDRRGVKLDDLQQILLGGIVCAAGYAVLAAGNAWSGGARLPLAWALAYLLLVDTAIVLIWPSGLSLIAGTAPRRRVGSWMGLFYLHGFFGSLWVGLIGSYYGRIAPTQFWLLHASVAAVGPVLILLFGLPLQRALRTRQAITTSA